MLRLIAKDNGGEWSRREFLQVGALSAAGLTLPQYLETRRCGETGDERSCILIFNVGGPSHLDTFDMKPDAPAEIRGPFRPIRTRSAGLEVSELLPGHARIANRFSLVRSCCHNGPAVHDVGWQMMQTGRAFTQGVETPHAGAVIAYLRGHRGEVPPHVVLPATMGRGGGNLPNGQAGGFLGTDYDPYAPFADSSAARLELSDAPPSDLGIVRVAPGRPLRPSVEGVLRRVESMYPARLENSAVSAAYDLMSSSAALTAFDLSREPPQIRDRYGVTRFGQCCLLARRLIEAGVRFVTINTFQTVFDQTSWDIHGSRPFTTLREMKEVVAPMYDRGYAALIEDLHERGMLDRTLVASLCEFGRTPRINAAGGRDHWPQCFTVCFAGGGVQGGRVIGRSDRLGSAPDERPVGPAELVATVYQSLGLDLATRLPGPQGTSLPLVDPAVQAIHELFA